jgi:hypothetical protein
MGTKARFLVLSVGVGAKSRLQTRRQAVGWPKPKSGSMANDMRRRSQVTGAEVVQARPRSGDHE